VFTERQGRGIGRDVMRWLVDCTFAVAPNVWAAVSAFNHGARAFYRAIGVVELCALTDLIKPGCDEILIRRTRPTT
jgi:GNAT superfamily N-acetyltransferase